MKVPFVDLVTWAKPSRDEYLAAFAKVIDTGAFVGGPQVAEFEAAFAKFTGAAHAVAVKTGTDALLLALRALNVGPGDEVITAANSFFATAEAISHAGATPVLADVDDETLLIDLDDADRRVTKRTKAIIPVHLFGQLVGMDGVNAFARGHGLRVLEDSAQAHGATRGGYRAGSAGEVAAFSFYPTKNLGAIGEGGAVTTSDAAVADRVRRLRDHGQAGRHEHVDIAYNARLDSVQCACLAITLRRLPAANDARRTLAARYRERLAGSAARLLAVAHYPTPIHLQPAYAHLHQHAGSCPVAERAVKEMISLPMFPDLTVDQVDYVCDQLRSAL